MSLQNSTLSYLELFVTLSQLQQKDKKVLSPSLIIQDVKTQVSSHTAWKVCGQLTLSSWKVCSSLIPSL